MINWYSMANDNPRDSAAARPVQPQPSSSARLGESTVLPLWRDSLFWLTLALSLFAVAPFMLPGYFWGANDARHHVYFLFEFDRLVQDGIWWPRWSPDFAFGYGYPFFNIYAPLSHFLAELLLHFGGLSYTAAIESIFGLSVVASAAAMYAFVRDWGSRHMAVVAALVYVYAPYHLLNLYVRANLTESMALVWLPLCLWTVRQATLRPSYGWFLGVALSFAGLMLTSNLVFVLFSPFLGLYLALLGARQAGRVGGAPRVRAVGAWVGRWIRQVWVPGLGLAAGLGCSAVFWLPMALERQYVRVDQWFDGRYDFRGHFLYFFQLFSPRWGFKASIPGPDDLMGFQLGPVPLILAVVGVILVWRQVPSLRGEIAFWAGVGLVTTLLTLRWAAPLWDLPLLGTFLGFAQFPWRWFSVTLVCLSLLAALPLHPALGGGGTSLRLNLPLLAVILLVLLGSYPLLRVEIVPPAEGPVGLPALMRFQQSSDEMTGSTAWVKEIPTWSPMADEYISREKAGEAVTPVASMVDYTTLNYNRETGFVVNSESRSSIHEEVWYWSPLPGRRIVFNQFYYPGWRAYLLDGKHGKPVRELPIVPEGCLPPGMSPPKGEYAMPCPPLPPGTDDLVNLAEEPTRTDSTLGRMTVPVPPGEGYVLLRYEDTPPRTIGKFISLATFVILLLTGVLSGVLSDSGRPLGRQWIHRR